MLTLRSPQHKHAMQLKALADSVLLTLLWPQLHKQANVSGSQATVACSLQARAQERASRSTSRHLQTISASQAVEYGTRASLQGPARVKFYLYCVATMVRRSRHRASRIKAHFQHSKHSGMQQRAQCVRLRHGARVCIGARLRPLADCQLRYVLGYLPQTCQRLLGHRWVTTAL